MNGTPSAPAAPARPLVDAFGGVQATATGLGVTPRAVHRYLQIGLPRSRWWLDRAAVRAGTTPGALWPDVWWSLEDLTKGRRAA